MNNKSLPGNSSNKTHELNLSTIPINLWNMRELHQIISFIKHDIEALSKSVAEMKKTHAQVLTEEWIEGKTVMSILKIGNRKLQMHRDDGTLPFSQIDGKIYYKASDIDVLLNSNYNKK